MLSLGVSSDDARGKGLHHTEEGVIVIDNVGAHNDYAREII